LDFLILAGRLSLVLCLFLR